MWIRDDFPHGFVVDKRTMEIDWRQETRQTVTYSAKPHRRGKHCFHDLHLRIESKWKLLLVQERIPARQEVKVYPRLEPIRRVRKGYYRRQSLPDGALTMRTFGVGREFSHMREYQPDDDPRQINWLGSARQAKLISNVYQPEAGQEVAILLDCGRMMGVQNEGESQLDRALEASLGFAAIALERGERVSFLAFSERVLRYVPPGKGMAQLERIIEATYDLTPDYAESNYVAAWELITKSHHSQALITLFTDAANIAFNDSLSRMMNLAKKHHTVLTVSMQDPRWKEIKNRDPKREEDFYRQLVVEQLEIERTQMLKRWKSKKVITLDVEPNQLASEVIYSYLELRRRAAR
jgi:uncharacterized protein (DUF58 family)